MDLDLELESDGVRERTDDEALVRRARRGDREAFDELVREGYARVHALLFRMVGNHEDAEDLAQQTFVRAWDALGWYRGEGGFRAWLYRIALHLARDHQRARGRRPGALPLAALEVEPADALGRGPAQEAAGRELSRWIAGALARLPHRHRAALVLRVHEGLEYGEVARVIGVRPHTARFYVMKARRQLLRGLAAWRREGRS